MKIKNRVIKVITNEQLQNCMNTNCIVQVWIQDEYDKQGTIVTFDDEIVRIESEYYFRKVCTFFAVDKYYQVLY